MQTITPIEITATAPEDALAAIEELEITGKLTSTNGEDIAVTDAWGTVLTSSQAVEAVLAVLV